MFRRLVVGAALVLSIGSWVTSPIEGQIVSGQVVDSVSGLAVGTGFVVLVDESGREVARALSQGDGRFSVAAPVPGTYSLRSERIGYSAFTSSPFQLENGQVRDVTLRILAQAIVLAAVEVQGEDRCNTNPSQARQTGLVWQEIRKALAATAWDSTQELARYRTYGYRRSWNLSREEIVSEVGNLQEGFARQPYASIPIDTLLRDGFVVERNDEVWYNLPDAAVLQNDGFLEVHCFHVVRDPIGRPGQVGLAFEPMSRNGLPDVRGALWLDEASSELRELDVSFTELPHNVEDDRVGGTVEFMMLPSGAWVVHRWQVRAPSIRVLTGGTREVGDRSQRIGVFGFNDTGGDVLEITTRDGELVYPPGLAHVSGSVYDSTRSGPLSNATIALENTEFWGRSDERGDYHFTVPLQGEHTLALMHPWIDSIGSAVPRQNVWLTSGALRTVDFDVPHANSIARRNCDYGEDAVESATIFGLVRVGSSGRAAEGRRIRASWQRLQDHAGRFTTTTVETVARTDESGRYSLCGLPVAVPVTIETDGVRPANIIFPRGDGGVLLFSRGRNPGEPYQRSFRTGHHTWKVDLLIAGVPAARNPETSTRWLSGYVTDDRTGRPLSGVSIVLNGSDTTETRIDGTFDISSTFWSEGYISLTASRGGYGSWEREIWLNGNEAVLELSIRLQRPND